MIKHARGNYNYMSGAIQEVVCPHVNVKIHRGKVQKETKMLSENFQLLTFV